MKNIRAGIIADIKPLAKLALVVDSEDRYCGSISFSEFSGYQGQDLEVFGLVRGGECYF